MKLFLRYMAGFVALAMIALFTMFAKSEPTKTAKVFEGVSILDDSAPSNCYRHTLPAGTITNAENDTISVPAQFLDAWIPSVWLETTRASGTMAINLIIQESSLLTGNTWVSVDTIAIGNAATGQARLDYPFAPYHMRGLRARVIVDGSGTQSVTYTGRFIAKRNN